MKVIKDNGDFSILDYGCGYGALLRFMKSFYLEFDYTGFDVSSEMLAHANEIFGSNSTTKWKDKLQDENFDYAIASGIFNVKQNQPTDIWQSYVIGILQDLNTNSKNGFAFNMLTSYSDPSYMKDCLYYADPCFYFDFCKRNFSKNVALLHDYGLYEFSILNKINYSMNKLIIFGTGDIAQIANYYFETDSEYEVIAFTVDKEYMQRSVFENKPVIPFENIEETFSPDLYQMFIATSYAQLNKIRTAKYKEAKRKGYKMASYVSSKC